MNYPEIENRYIIAWSTNNLVALVNLTEDDKRQVMRIIMDDPDQHLWSNPIREIIVYGVSNKISGFELWEVQSTLKDDAIVLEFSTSPDNIKKEFRKNGILLYK